MTQRFSSNLKAVLIKHFIAFPAPSQQLPHHQDVNPNIILAKIQQLSWWTRSHKALAYQDNCCESHQFNPGIYTSV
jgi:hypothetical protein